MKFTYVYRTRDNVVHEGVLSALSLDDVYRKLKGKGVKPFNVRLAPGLINRLSYFCYRWVVLLLLVVAVASVVGVAIKMRLSPVSNQVTSRPALPRHCIDKLPGDWGIVLMRHFDSEVDRLLACFAQPGRVLSVTGISLPKGHSFDAALEKSPMLSPSDPGWVVELKQMVVGMKEDIIAMRRAGKTESEIALWLTERQSMEANYRRQIEGQVLSGALTKDNANRILSAMGLEPL